MVGWPVLVPPHGPCSVVAVRERDPRRRDDEHMAVRTSVLPRTSAVRFRAPHGRRALQKELLALSELLGALKRESTQIAFAVAMPGCPPWTLRVGH